MRYQRTNITILLVKNGSEKQLRNTDVCQEVSDEPESIVSTVHRTIEKISRKGDL